VQFAAPNLQRLPIEQKRIHTDREAMRGRRRRALRLTRRGVHHASEKKRNRE
jgi:hypothetical protein